MFYGFVFKGTPATKKLGFASVLRTSLRPWLGGFRASGRLHGDASRSQYNMFQRFSSNFGILFEFACI